MRPIYTRAPGLYDHLIFPIDKKKLAPPAEIAATCDEALACVEHLDQGGWNWQGPTRIDLPVLDGGIDVFAWLAFAWAMTAKVPGALKFRPILLTTGPSEQGKSELLNRLRDMIGAGWHYTVDDPSEAGISATVGKARIAVLLDEFEGKETDPAFAKKILAMMLRSFNAGKRTRSSADLKAVETELFCSMQGSTVLAPKMKPTERNRAIVVEIGYRKDLAKPYVLPPFFATIGPKLHRRMAEQWGRYPATLAAYSQAMTARGISPRYNDCYATALACADLVLFEETPAHDAARLRHIVDCIVPLLETVRDENIDHPDLALDALLSSHLPSPGGQVQQTVAQWIEKALLAKGGYDDAGWATAKLQLASNGMRLCNLTDDHARGKAGVIELEELATGYLAIAGPTHEAVVKIFKATEFNQGRWPGALGRLVRVERNKDGAETGQMPAIKGKIPWIGGRQYPCTLIPLAYFIDLYEISEQIAVARDAAAMGQEVAEAKAKKRRKERGIRE